MLASLSYLQRNVDHDDNGMIILISMAMAAVKYAEEKVDNVHAGGEIMMI